MSLLDRKVRGFKLVDVVALGLLAALVLGVYLAKTIAGRERAEIARIERQIAAERGRIRLLEAEVSHLEQPARIGQLSQAYLGMVPATAKNEATTEQLDEIAEKAAKAKPKAAAPAKPAIAAPPPPAAVPAAPVLEAGQ
ncbi:cell division protein [Phenylobacterium terrae]|uniref:Cell division protein n=1 Tax=Phenylobacterium terrae TaxID=2665495 RepID=A0ABW4N6R6_9CAUL